MNDSDYKLLDKAAKALYRIFNSHASDAKTIAAITKPLKDMVRIQEEEAAYMLVMSIETLQDIGVSAPLIKTLVDDLASEALATGNAQLSTFLKTEIIPTL